MKKKILLNYILATVFILTLNFLLPRLMPGDPLQAIYGQDAMVSLSEEQKVEISKEFGLDKPLSTQARYYFSNLVKGNLGYSYYYRQPVTSIIRETLPWTLLLAGSALVISTFVGSLLGFMAGWQRGQKKDNVLLILLMFVNGFPDFFMGMILLLVFAVNFSLFPIGGAMSQYSNLRGLGYYLDILWHLVLPLLSLVLSSMAGVFLLARNSMISTLGRPYIFTAKAKGLTTKRIKIHHAGRNAIFPILTAMGVRVGFVFTGALFVEIIFSYPGAGHLIYQALQARDYPLLQGILLMVSTTILLANFIVELLYYKLEPRLKDAC